MKYYKYRSTSKYSIDGLINNQIYLSSFEEFNDPFEFSNPLPVLSEYNRRARAEIEKLYNSGIFTYEIHQKLTNAVAEPEGNFKFYRQKIESKIVQGMRDMGVFSLSKTVDEILMWSHYAEEHKGFCIEFESIETSLDINIELYKVNYVDHYQDMNNPSELIKFYITMYSKKYDLPKKKWDKLARKLGVEVRKKEEMNLALAVVRNKYTSWSYENEWRLISRRNQGLVKYDPKCVKSIIFGLRMPDFERQKIMKLCNEDGKKHIKFKNAVKKNNSLGIDIIDLEKI